MTAMLACFCAFHLAEKLRPAMGLRSLPLRMPYGMIAPAASLPAMTISEFKTKDNNR